MRELSGENATLSLRRDCLDDGAILNQLEFAKVDAARAVSFDSHFASCFQLECVADGLAVHLEAETLIEIQSAKVLIPRILQVIHESVPVEEGVLAEAKTRDDVLQAIATGQAPPRGQRKAVKITSLDMRYEPDVKVYTWEDGAVYPAADGAEYYPVGTVELGEP